MILSNSETRVYPFSALQAGFNVRAIRAVQLHYIGSEEYSVKVRLLNVDVVVELGEMTSQLSNIGLTLRTVMLKISDAEVRICCRARAELTRTVMEMLRMMSFGLVSHLLHARPSRRP